MFCVSRVSITNPGKVQGKKIITVVVLYQFSIKAIVICNYKMRNYENKDHSTTDYYQLCIPGLPQGHEPL